MYKIGINDTHNNSNCYFLMKIKKLMKFEEKLLNKLFDKLFQLIEV